MKKVLLFLMVCMLLSHTLIGQTKIMRFPANILESFKATVATDPTLLPWGYCEGDADNPVGINQTAELSAAIFIPTSLVSQYVGNQIRGISVFLTAKSKTLSVFIASSLTGERLYEQSVGDGNIGWNEVMLTTPFDLTANDIYVGYTCTGKNQIGFASGPSVENASWLEAGGEWQNYVKEGWGSLGINVLLGGDQMPENYLTLGTLDYAYAEINKSFVLSGYVKNEGLGTVENFDLNYKVGAIEGTTNIIMNLSPSDKGEFEITVPALTEAGDFDSKVTITNVNGVSNENLTSNSAISKVTCIEIAYPRKVVLEEGTGTWCGWCPRGMVAMKLMKEKYPETSIGIAIHSGDKMSTSTYSTKFFTGYPSSVVNRKSEYVGDPYYDMEDYYKKEAKIPAQIGISVVGDYINADQKILRATSTTTFGLAKDNANYKITFVIIENGVTGYTQTNSYAGGNYGEMGGFEKLPGTVPADKIVYDEVARGIFPYDGIKNSVPTNVVKGESYTYTAEITLPTTIQNKANIELIALLLDGKTGEIINANKIEAKDLTIGTSIESINGDRFNIKSIVRENTLNVEVVGEGEILVELFNIEGRKIESSVISGNGAAHFSVSGLKGVYFVKATNGKNIEVNKVVFN